MESWSMSHSAAKTLTDSDIWDEGVRWVQQVFSQLQWVLSLNWFMLRQAEVSPGLLSCFSAKEGYGRLRLSTTHAPKATLPCWSCCAGSGIRTGHVESGDAGMIGVNHLNQLQGYSNFELILLETLERVLLFPYIGSCILQGMLLRILHYLTTVCPPLAQIRCWDEQMRLELFNTFQLFTRLWRFEPSTTLVAGHPHPLGAWNATREVAVLVGLIISIFFMLGVGRSKGNMSESGDTPRQNVCSWTLQFRSFHCFGDSHGGSALDDFIWCECIHYIVNHFYTCFFGANFAFSRIRSLLKEAICTGHSQAFHAAFQPVSWHTVPGYSLFPYLWLLWCSWMIYMLPLWWFVNALQDVVMI